LDQEIDGRKEGEIKLIRTVDEKVSVIREDL